MNSQPVTPQAPHGVVISACQQISALGCGAESVVRDDAIRHLLAGSTESRASVELEPDVFRFAGYAPDANTRQMDPLAEVSMVCANLALRADTIGGEGASVFLGSGYGCHTSNQAFLDTLISKGPRFVQPVVFRNTVSNAAAGHMAIRFAITGTNTVLNSGMVSGVQALALAYDELRWGRSEVALAGASDWTDRLLVNRYLAHEYAAELPPALPLLDGAVFCVLRRVGASAPGWHVRGFSLGRLPADGAPERLGTLVEEALARAGMDFEAIGTLVLNAGPSRCWIRESHTSSLDQVCGIVASELTCPPQFENTSVTPMLALLEALLRLPRGEAPVLFTNQAPQPAPAMDSLVFCSVGRDGNVVALVLEYRAGAVAEEQT